MVIYISGWLLFTLIVMLVMYLSLQGTSDTYTKNVGLGTNQSRLIILVIIFLWFIFNTIYKSYVPIEFIVSLG